MAIYIPAPPAANGAGCRWPLSARGNFPCNIQDLPLRFYGQDAPDRGCVQDCGGGFDIKTSITAYWSTGAITRGKEGCPNTSTPEIQLFATQVLIGRAWKVGLWTSSVVVEWWAYRWATGPGSFHLISATWLAETRTKYAVPVAGFNGQRCAFGMSLLCRCTCYDDGTFTFE